MFLLGNWWCCCSLIDQDYHMSDLTDLCSSFSATRVSTHPLPCEMYIPEPPSHTVIKPSLQDDDDDNDDDDEEDDTDNNSNDKDYEPRVTRSRKASATRTTATRTVVKAKVKLIGKEKARISKQMLACHRRMDRLQIIRISLMTRLDESTFDIAKETTMMTDFLARLNAIDA
jgi:hypothetical protein